MFICLVNFLKTCIYGVLNLFRRIAMRTKVLTDRRLTNTSNPRRTSRNVLMSKVSDLVAQFDSIALQEDAYPELSPKQETEIENALHGGPSTETIITRFNLTITRTDLDTLSGDNRLNDQVINFYMNLLMERSTENPNLPKVYAMNTFFLPKLLSSGHAALRRWTRRVDLFAHDLILIPVHIGLVHWCMAIVDLPQRSIRYYDSLGGLPNEQAMDALEEYLREESLDKRGRPLEGPDFEKRHMRECPRQEASNDCGVFSCAFAEHEARRCTAMGFGQPQMAYFRRKMVWEIAQGRLIT